MELTPYTQGAAVGVVFDGDDTLWSTEELYDEARNAAGDAVADFGLDAVKWEELERRADIDNMAIFGYSCDRFPTSCVQAFEELCRIEGRTPDISAIDRIRLAAQSVFDRDAPLVPSARATLERLRARGARLALLTKGEVGVQERRIKCSGLEHLFDVIEVVQEKTPSAISAVVDRLGVVPGSTWMVGNSARSDVVPALAAGMRAVWIDANVWEYERTHNDLVDDRVVKAQSLAEVPYLIGN